MTTLKPTPEVTLTLASPTDLNTLQEILCLSYLPEVIAQFFLLDWPSLDSIRPHFQARLEKRFAQPTTQIFKLTSPETNEILGLVCLSEEDEEEVQVRDPKNPSGTKVPPTNVNIGFAMEIMRVMGPLERIMVGKRHLLITSLGVLPKYQGHGLGSLLLKKCNEIADERGLPVFLTAFPGAYDLYKKHGFEEVGHGDTDMNKFGKPYRGFGIYRHFAMLRQPVAAEH